MRYICVLVVAFVVGVVFCCSIKVFLVSLVQTLVMEIGSWLLDLSHVAVSVDYAHPRYTTTLSYCFGYLFSTRKRKETTVVCMAPYKKVYKMR